MIRALENPKLLAAISAVADHDDARTRHAFYSALLGSTLLLPTEAPACSGPKRDGLRLFTTPPAGDGSWKLLAFTDMAAATAWKGDGAALTRRTAKELFALAVASPTSAILLNVAGPTGGELSRREFTALAEGSIPLGEADTIEEMQLDAGAEVLVAAPAKPPGEAFLGVLRMALQESGGVRAGWLADVAFEAGELHAAVGVRVSDGLSEQELRGIFDGVMARIQPLLGHGRYLDFIVIDEVWGPLFESAGQPVYERAER